MSKSIESPTVGEILKEEFMVPYDLSADLLAQGIHVPVSLVQDILHDRRKITADTSLRLAKFFGVSELYFLNIQKDIDIRNLRSEIGADLESIVPIRESFQGGNKMEYKGYRAHVEFDPVSKVYHGKIEGVEDLVTFESNDADAIEGEFHKAVEDYISFCEDVGKFKSQ